MTRCLLPSSFFLWSRVGPGLSIALYKMGEQQHIANVS